MTTHYGKSVFMVTDVEVCVWRLHVADRPALKAETALAQSVV